ncbi:hypothetical protein [Roseibium album]|nr:hypothetical protein [Roseibium album]
MSIIPSTLFVFILKKLKEQLGREIGASAQQYYQAYDVVSKQLIKRTEL